MPEHNTPEGTECEKNTLSKYGGIFYQLQLAKLSAISIIVVLRNDLYGTF